MSFSIISLREQMEQWAKLDWITCLCGRAARRQEDIGYGK